MSWYDFYKDRINERYRRHLTRKYGFLVNSVAETDYENYVEIGCGAGNITRLVRDIHNSEANYTLVDNCPRMLSLSIENNQHHNCNFKISDVRKRLAHGFNDTETLVHSHGLLEHFSNEDIIKIIDEADAISNEQFHYVPSDKYDEPSFGDERLLSPRQWEAILSLQGQVGFDIKEFNEGKDLLIHIYRNHVWRG